MQKYLRLLGILAGLSLPAVAQTPAGYIPVTGTKITDASGVAASNVTLCGQVVATSTTPISVQAGAGGHTTTPPVCTTVTNGGFSLNLPDTSATSPANACVSITVTDNITGDQLLGPGYGCVQPTSATGSTWCSNGVCNFDLFPPNLPSLGTISLGPIGPQGPQGIQGPTGAPGTLASASGPLNISGNFVATSGVIGQNGPTTTTQVNFSPTFAGAGFSLGGNVPGGYGGWSTSKTLQISSTFLQRGIKQSFGEDTECFAEGDCGGFYGYVYGPGGIRAGGDEGITGITMHAGERQSYGFYTVLTTTGTGDQAPKLTRRGGPTSLVDGAVLLDTSKGNIACSLTGASTNFQFYVNQLPTTCTNLPLTTAYGATTGPINESNSTADQPQTQTITVTLGTIGGAVPAFVPGLVGVSGPNRPEQAMITSVQPPSGGTQVITGKFRNPNNTGAILFQGGLVGQYLSFDANLALSGMRSSYTVFGSIDGTHLLYTFIIGGGQDNNTLPQLGLEAAQTSGANAGFHLYPGAEVVASYSNSFNNAMLEPNNVQWQTGDYVENPNFTQQGGHGIWLQSFSYSPVNGASKKPGLQIDLVGPGTNAQTEGISMYGGQTQAWYGDGGGPLAPPIPISLHNAWGTILASDFGPATGNSIIEMRRLSNNISQTNWTAPINLISFDAVTNGYINIVPHALLSDGSYAAVWGLRNLRVSGELTIGSNGYQMYDNQGTGVKVQHSTGSIATGHIMAADATGNTVDSGLNFLHTTVAPTGACSGIVWVLSDDGHVTFCNGSSYISKI